MHVLGSEEECAEHAKVINAEQVEVLKDNGCKNIYLNMKRFSKILIFVEIFHI